MTTPNIEKLYRGSINNNDRFYLVARLNSSSGQANSIKSGIGITDTSQNPYFMLCLDKYSISGVNYHRFYWSKDPIDFVPQLEANSFNQGAVEMFFKTINNQSYNLSYTTNLNQSDLNTNEKVYNLPNINNKIEINPNDNFNYNIAPTTDKNYNLSGSIIQTSVSYNLSFFGNNNIDWIFRKDITVTDGGADREPIATLTPSTNNFLTLTKAKTIRSSGTPTSSNELQLSLNGFVTTTNFLSIDKIPENGGIAKMTQTSSGSEEYFSFSNYNKTTKFITYIKRGLFDTTKFTPDTSNPLTITIVLSNESDNFTDLSSILGGNFDTTVEYIDLFFVPALENSYLTRGFPLVNITNYTLTSGAVEFYNYLNGIKFNNGLDVIDKSFLCNYLNNTLPANFSDTTFDPSYPLIPIYDKGNDPDTSTALIWTTHYESLKSIYYSYCKGDDFCGNCMGLTQNRQFYCHVNNDTIENYKFSGTVGATNNDTIEKNPLSSDPRNSFLNSIYENYTVPIVIGSIVLVVVIFGLIWGGILRSKLLNFEHILNIKN